ncbi:MAG TPA: NAD(P)-dependent oxidoreductase [Candidatus Binatia bacterium]|nr:NAD(P)-dependent oxidoreductase [Candidatus Binatia bacterium]
MAKLEGKRILITGVGGQVALPVARALAPANEVFGLARFRRAEDRERIAALGVRCVAADLGDGSLDDVPDDVDYVLHFAVAKSRDASFDADLDANAGGTGRLLHRCRRARAFLHCSSTGVYEAAGDRRLRETDPLGDNHRAILPTYSISKIAAEAIARFGAREWNVPVTIARLNVPYGDNGGWPALHLDWMLAGQPIPVHPSGPSLYNPIHEDDIAAQIPHLLGAASVPATVFNWAGDETVALEEWCSHLGDLVGAPPRFFATDRTIGSVAVDTSRLHAIAGATRVKWRDGMRRMVAARHPEVELRV